MSDARGTNAAATVEKALLLIEAMSNARAPCGVTQLSRMLGVNKTTVHRLLETLRRHGYVRQDPHNNQYALTPKLWELGASLIQETSLYTVTPAYLSSAAAETGETTSLAIPVEDHALIINQVVSFQLLQAVLPVGSRVPLHSTALGKAMMIDWSMEHIRRHAKEATAEQPITSIDNLVADLEDARRNGFAVAVDEWRLGVTAVAAGIRDFTGNIVGSVGIAGPTARLQAEQIEPLGRKAASTASQISFEMGHRAVRLENAAG